MSRRLIMMLVLFGTAGVCSGQSPAPTTPRGSLPLKRVLDAYARNDSSDNRILVGKKTTIAENPWQVALVATAVPSNLKAQFCGGSIIAKRWVLTAAHCVDQNTLPSQISVLVGTESLRSGGQRVTVVEHGIIVHEKWNPQTHDFDAALINVSSDLPGTAIQPFSSTDPAVGVGQLVRITGWGALAWRAPSGSKDLQLTEVPYVALSDCNSVLSYNNQVTTNMFCAGRLTGGPDACQGDSGGPATIDVAGTRKIIGIISWGDGCGLPRKYGVYALLPTLVEWINNKTSPSTQPQGQGATASF
jgi:secreted trypsin-like serine protease